MKTLKTLTAISLALALFACNSSTSSDDNNDDPQDNPVISRSLPLTLDATLASASRSLPGLPGGIDIGDIGDYKIPEGTDLDQDGGISRYNTPTGFSVAIKKLTATHEDGTIITLIAESADLASATTFDLINPQNIVVDTAYSGHYVSAEVEFYYYDITMELNTVGNYANLRIYLSDDDFTQEGNLGHHQGDIQLMKSDQSYSWVQAGEAWQEANLDMVRPTTIGGASSADPETGHDRGLFGNNLLWNNSLFMQGAEQDIFKASIPIDLVIPEVGGGMRISFDLTDTWYYEDFDDNQIFNPCFGGSQEGCSDGADWNPTFPMPVFTVLQ